MGRCARAPNSQLRLQQKLEKYTEYEPFARKSKQTQSKPFSRTQLFKRLLVASTHRVRTPAQKSNKTIGKQTQSALEDVALHLLTSQLRRRHEATFLINATKQAQGQLKQHSTQHTERSHELR